MRYFFFFVILAAGSTAMAASFDAPKRKSGLWEIKFSSGQAKTAHSMQQCIDEKTDDLMKKEMGDNQRQCSKNEMRKEGDKIVVDSVCKVQNSTATTHAVFTGRFDSAYKADIRSSYEPPMAGMKESSSVIEAKWLGPCNAGQKPGDVTIPGMPNINIEEMRKRAVKKP
ncbi:MAG TPA: DUF3617 family protein [Terriglobales bacterium]|nr:DUF3617 family protein [Terriglobales bacterium]